jgi:hypothetical protein
MAKELNISAQIYFTVLSTVRSKPRDTIRSDPFPNIAPIQPQPLNHYRYRHEPIVKCGDIRGRKIKLFRPVRETPPHCPWRTSSD